MLADTLNDKNLQKVNYILQTQNGLSDFGLSDVLLIFTFSAGDSWRGNRDAEGIIDNIIIILLFNYIYNYNYI